jgi:hypothetical protein
LKPKGVFRACRPNEVDSVALIVSVRRTLAFPSITFHDAARRRLDLPRFEDKTFTFVPAPCFFIFANTAQPDFVGQMRSRESEQPPAKVLALIS